MKVLIGTGPRLLAASEGDDFASLAAVRGERSGSGQPGVGVRFDADGRHVWISIDWLRHGCPTPPSSPVRGCGRCAPVPTTS
jgi:hypothetical protein